MLYILYALRIKGFPRSIVVYIKDYSLYLDSSLFIVNLRI